MRILVTGAAGNLGSRVARSLLESPHELRLLLHRSRLPFDIPERAAVSTCQADLEDPAALARICAGIDCVVHLAGVLFVPRPEKVLPKTNVGYVRHLAHAAVECGVRKFILVSFPHVEGETTPSHPAGERLDAVPSVIHFRTRLEAERALFDECKSSAMVPVIFRAGIVYGKGIKLFDAARWMLQHRLLATWRAPTWAHLISLPDFLAALRAAIDGPQVTGIYQVCDDRPLMLQELLDKLADHYGYPRPWRLPCWAFHAAGWTCETAAWLLRTSAPLNRDIVRAGMTSCVADTSRMKKELLPSLMYPTIDDGIALL